MLIRILNDICKLNCMSYLAHCIHIPLLFIISIINISLMPYYNDNNNISLHIIHIIIIINIILIFIIVPISSISRNYQNNQSQLKRNIQSRSFTYSHAPSHLHQHYEPHEPHSNYRTHVLLALFSLSSHQHQHANQYQRTTANDHHRLSSLPKQPNNLSSAIYFINTTTTTTTCSSLLFSKNIHVRHYYNHHFSLFRQSQHRYAVISALHIYLVNVGYYSIPREIYDSY